MGKCGGLGDLKEADETLLSILEKLESELKGKVSEKLGSEPSHLHPIGYKTQVVAGTNFFVKLRIGDEENRTVHARIYRDLQGNLSLHSVTEEKASSDELEYFG